MNTPVTQEEMIKFKHNTSIHIGGKAFAYNNADGSAVYYPNRRERRAYLNQPGSNMRKSTRGRRTITLMSEGIVKTQFKDRR